MNKEEIMPTTTAYKSRMGELDQNVNPNEPWIVRNSRTTT
jgi:hypothetical protein